MALYGFTEAEPERNNNTTGFTRWRNVYLEVSAVYHMGLLYTGSLKSWNWTKQRETSEPRVPHHKDPAEADSITRTPTFT